MRVAVLFLLVLFSTFEARATVVPGDAFSVRMVSSSFCGSVCTSAAPVVLRGFYCGMPAESGYGVSAVNIVIPGSDRDPVGFYYDVFSRGALPSPVVYPYLSNVSRTHVSACALSVDTETGKGLVTATINVFSNYLPSSTPAGTAWRSDTVVFEYTPVEEGTYSDDELARVPVQRVAILVGCCFLFGLGWIAGK